MLVAAHEKPANSTNRTALFKRLQEHKLQLAHPICIAANKFTTERTCSTPGRIPGAAVASAGLFATAQGLGKK